MVQPNTLDRGKTDVGCLAEAIYREAGGESEIGKIAVAHVVLNRANSNKFPASICSVVFQKVGRVCQFSWVCTKTTIAHREHILNAVPIAQAVLKNSVSDPTNGALFFRHKSIKIAAKHRKKSRPVTIGNHVFY